MIFVGGVNVACDFTHNATGHRAWCRSMSTSTEILTRGISFLLPTLEIYRCAVIWPWVESLWRRATASHIIGGTVGGTESMAEEYMLCNSNT